MLIKYLLLAAFVQILWALTPSASNIVIQEISVELFIAIRWTISGLIFLFAALSFKKKIDWSPKMLPKYFLLGVSGYGLSSIGALYGLKIGGVVNFALLSSVNPIVVAFMSILLLKEKVDRKYWIAAPLCVFGLVIMVMGKYELSGASVAISSALLILMCYFFESLPFVFSKKFSSKQSLIGYMAILQLSAAIFMWGAQIAHFKQFSELASLSLRGLGAMIFVSVVACVICYALLYWLLRFIDGHRLAIFDGIHAIFAALYGVWLFNESFNLLMVLGGGLLITSLYLANSPSKKNLSKTVPVEAI